MKKTKINKTDLEKLERKINKVNKLFADKSFISKSSTGELELTYHYIINWIQKDLAGFVNELKNSIDTRKKQT